MAILYNKRHGFNTCTSSQDGLQMTLEQIEMKLIENKKLQSALIKSMAKSKNNQFATILELKSLTYHQEELERKRKEEIDLFRISIRKRITEKGNALYTSLSVPLKYLAGEIMRGNEETVLNQVIAGRGKTIGVETILNMGFTTNQVELLLRQSEWFISKATSIVYVNNNLTGAVVNNERIEVTTQDLLTFVKYNKDKSGQLQRQLEKYQNAIKIYCHACYLVSCSSRCPLWSLRGWK